jgi:hypothetical protein
MKVIVPCIRQAREIEKSKLCDIRFDELFRVLKEQDAYMKVQDMNKYNKVILNKEECMWIM